MKSYYLLTAVLISSIVAGSVNVALSIGGRLKVDGGTGRCGLLSASTNMSKSRVLSAAPVNVMRIPVLNFGFTKRNAPPPYVKSVFPIVQFSQSKPSSCSEPPLKSEFFITNPFNGGTIGIDAASVENCAQVDVWIPEDIINAQQAPTINDPSASITLDIIPSPSGRDCEIWHYHYLRKGEKPPPNKAQPAYHQDYAI